MRARPIRPHLRIAARTASLGLAVLLVSFSSASAAQTAGPQPTGPGASDFENGRAQFHRTCAQCHGRNMVNSGVTVYDVRKFPTDQPERFFTSVTDGKGNMPSFRDALSSEQLRWLWTYVSSRGTPP
ncbi:MAG: c-type cytochrome [Betaproteobacteria bacterium]